MSEQSGGAEGAPEPDSWPSASASRPDEAEQPPAQDSSRPGGAGYPPPRQPVVPSAGWPQRPAPYPPHYPAPYPYPQPPHPGARPPAPAGPPPRIEPVPGTGFGLAYFSVPPVVSGQAIGSMVAGILSILVALVVGCFGLVGAKPGWGPIVGGAFAILAATAGLAAIALGWISVRQITRSAGRLAGRGMAIAGTSCGAAGMVLTAAAMLLALLI